VETDFLFGLRSGDRNHRGVARALSMSREGSLAVSVLSSAVVEARATLYSKGFSYREVEDAVALMDAALAGSGVNSYAESRLSDVVLSEIMRAQFSELTFFDSLHAATSKRLGVSILSSDPIYKRIRVDSVGYDEL
jgi:hypothetical protein